MRVDEQTAVDQPTADDQLTTMTVPVDPRADARWHRLARRDDAHLFISPGWIAATCDTYGFTPQARIVVLRPDGEPIAGLAWVRVSDFRGARDISLPFSDRADPIADVTTWEQLSAGVVEPGVPLGIRAFDDSVLSRDARFSVVGEAAWHGTPLGRSPEDLRRRINSHTRRKIAAGERSGLRIEMRADVEAVRAFHGLHVQLRKRKYRLLAQPRELFERIWSGFAPTDSIRTVLAFLGDELVAGAMYLIWNDVLYYKFGASLAEHLAFRPNELIAWNAMVFGIDRELRLLDWGLSDLDQPGLVAYKRKWASQERRIVTYRTSGGPSAAEADAGRVLGRMTDLLTDPSVPDDVSERAGELLYRYFC